MNRCVLLSLATFVSTACGGASSSPRVADVPASAPAIASSAPPAPKPPMDDCAPGADGTPAKPLRIAYEGLAKGARCDREVYTIMGGVVDALGVPCEYCHVKGDYVAATQKKDVANWMAAELVPALHAKNGKRVWCPTCHKSDGEGKAKILGNPRTRERSVEWMTAVMYERLETAHRDPLKCAACHQAPIGSEAFEKEIILHTERLPTE